jgi:hypothetical protein
MINEYTTKLYCKEDISLIQNYDKAISDNTQTWDCHHRKETDEGLSVKQLKEQNLYFDRPANELIFLTKSEHTSLHHKDKQYNDIIRIRISEGHKGQIPWNKGLKDIYLEETKQKMSEGHKGQIPWNKGLKDIYSEEIRQKNSEAHKGKHRVYDENGKYHYEW